MAYETVRQIIDDREALRDRISRVIAALDEAPDPPSEKASKRQAAACFRANLIARTILAEGTEPPQRREGRGCPRSLGRELRSEAPGCGRLWFSIRPGVLKKASTQIDHAGRILGVETERAVASSAIASASSDRTSEAATEEVVRIVRRLP